MAEPEIGQIRVRDCSVTVRRQGSGETLLYLHGAAGAAAWMPFMARLADGFDLVVPEHPGFGGSDTPDWLDNIHDLAYFYLDFLNHHDLDGVHLVGSSIGGWIALEMAVRDTSRLRTLTVSGAAGIHVDGVEKGDMFAWSPEETMNRLIVDPAVREKALAALASDADIDLQLKNRRTVARLAWAPRLRDPHLHKWLHRVDVPTHVIWGDGDRLLPPAYADAFGELIPGSRVTIIPECGHLPHIERHDLFCDAVEGFIREAGA